MMWYKFGKKSNPSFLTWKQTHLYSTATFIVDVSFRRQMAASPFTLRFRVRRKWSRLFPLTLRDSRLILFAFIVFLKRFDGLKPTIYFLLPYLACQNILSTISGGWSFVVVDDDCWVVTILPGFYWTTGIYQWLQYIGQWNDKMQN